MYEAKASDPVMLTKQDTLEALKEGRLLDVYDLVANGQVSEEDALQALNEFDELRNSSF